MEPHLGTERAQISIYLCRPCVQNSPTKDWRGKSSWLNPRKKRFRGHPRPRCSDYISDLAWSRLGVEPAELSEIAVDREVFYVLLGLLPPPPSLEEKRA